MKRVSKFSLLITVLALVLSVSCREKGCTDPEAVNYNEDAKKDDSSCRYITITLESPHGHAPCYESGDVMTIKGKIEADDLHDISIVLKNSTKGEEVMHVHDHAHHSPYNFEETYTFQVDNHTDFELVVTALDHDGNTKSKSVFPHVMPEGSGCGH